MRPLVLYSTQAQENEITNSFLRNGNTSLIYGLDITDERTRNEPWTSTDTATKKFIDDLVQANDYTYQSSRIGTGNNKNAIIKFSYRETLGDSLINIKNVDILERVGHYNYEDIHLNQGQGGTSEAYSSTNISESTTVFSNNETIENEEGNDKKVIQYIFIKK